MPGTGARLSERRQQQGQGHLHHPVRVHEVLPGFIGSTAGAFSSLFSALPLGCAIIAGGRGGERAHGRARGASRCGAAHRAAASGGPDRRLRGQARTRPTAKWSASRGLGAAAAAGARPRPRHRVAPPREIWRLGAAAWQVARRDGSSAAPPRLPFSSAARQTARHGAAWGPGQPPPGHAAEGGLTARRG